MKLFQHAQGSNGEVVVVHCLLLFLCLQVNKHTSRISVRVKLCADNIVVEAHTHDSPFVLDMGTHFLDTKNFASHFMQQLMVGLYQLVIAADDCIERIAETVQHMLFMPGFQLVYREYSKGSGFPLAYDAGIEIAAC